MLFGPHKGRRLLDVPASYLLDLFDEAPAEFVAKSHEVDLQVAKDLYAYINSNREYLQHEVDELNLKKRAWSLSNRPAK